jgi:hypothetical protein
MRAVVALVSTSVLLVASARAQPAPAVPAPETVVPAVVTAEPQPLQYFPNPPTRLRRSFGIATGEVLAINGLFWLVAYSIGKPYARISWDSVKTNLESDWVWDEDAFATNQFGHPYLGSLTYNAARANGFGMLGASLFSFAGSAFWELAMETEKPSINDQIFTPFGGVMFGEAVHRFGQALLWRHDPRPRVGRVVVSTLVDPIGMFTRSAFGRSWSEEQPPAMFGYGSIGWSGLTASFGTHKDMIAETTPLRLHVALGIDYGLPLDPSFRPRRPMDHFQFYAEGDVSSSDAFATIHTHGLLWGRGISLGAFNAVGGLFGGYDFENPKRINVGAASLGLGVTVHAGLGERLFFQGTAIASGIPFGAAGGDVDEDRTGVETLRDYHRGWGGSLVLNAKLGYRGVGMVYANSRNFLIDGAYFDEGSELITYTRAGMMLAVLGRHGIGVEGQLSVRRGDFQGSNRDVLDESTQLRISYVLMQDLTFGGGAR